MQKIMMRLPTRDPRLGQHSAVGKMTLKSPERGPPHLVIFIIEECFAGLE